MQPMAEADDMMADRLSCRCRFGVGGTSDRDVFAWIDMQREFFSELKIYTIILHMQI